MNNSYERYPNHIIFYYLLPVITKVEYYDSSKTQSTIDNNA